MAEWKMEAAKARLSEVVRQAQVEGPQQITTRGEVVALVLSQDNYDRLTQCAGANWVDRFRQSFTGEVDLLRD